VVDDTDRVAFLVSFAIQNYLLYTPSDFLILHKESMND
jgi:hypothetical protein